MLDSTRENPATREQPFGEMLHLQESTEPGKMDGWIKGGLMLAFGTLVAIFVLGVQYESRSLSASHGSAVATSSR